MKFFFTTCLIVFALIAFAAAHSWVACTDYRPTNRDNSVHYRAGRCKGYPRHWDRYNKGIFGKADKSGYHWNGMGCGPKQRMTNPRSNAYSKKYPMGRWIAGETRCLAWPSKNHVATRYNPGMPSHQLRLFRSERNVKRDPSQHDFFKHQILRFGPHVHMKPDYKGFQNCTAFSENNDKALCLGCFKVPRIPDGIYVMQWYWEFNKNEFYTTCFDIMVGKNTKLKVNYNNQNGGGKSCSASKGNLPLNPKSSKWWLAVTVPFNARNVKIDCGYGYYKAKRSNWSGRDFILGFTNKACTSSTVRTIADGKFYCSRMGGGTVSSGSNYGKGVLNKNSGVWWIGFAFPFAPRSVKIDCGYGYRGAKRSDWSRKEFILGSTGKACTRKEVRAIADGKRYKAYLR